MFKQGEIVVCIDVKSKFNPGRNVSNLVLNEKYEIAKDQRQGSQHVFVKLPNGSVVSAYAARFELEVVYDGNWNVGDKVLLRGIQRDFDEGVKKHRHDVLEKGFTYVGFATEMFKYDGRVVTIRRVLDRAKGTYKIEEDKEDGGWTYSAGWMYPPKQAGMPAKRAEKPVAGPKPLEVGEDAYIIKQGSLGVRPAYLPAMKASIFKKLKVMEVGKDYYVLSDGFAHQSNTVERFDAEKHKEYQPAALQKAINQAFERLEEAQHVASYVLVYEGKNPESGYVLSAHIGDICHARLDKTYRGSVGNGVCVSVFDALSYHQKTLPDNRKELYKEYIEYIINRSPWAPAYIEKDIEKVWEKGAEMNVDVHGDVLAGACVVARVGNEFSHMLEVFDMVKKAGYSEAVAWLISVSFTKNLDGKKYSIAEMGGGHHVIRSDLRTDALLSFMKNGYRKELLEPTEPYRVVQKYRITEPMQETKVCVKASPLNWSKFIQGNVEMVVEGEGFNQNKYIVEKSLLKFAKFIQSIIEG